MEQNQMQENIKKAQVQQKKQEEMMEKRNIMLQQCMTPEAKERLSRLALVKPEKAQRIEDMIIQNATMGALKSKIDENTLITYLEQMTDTEKQTSTIKFKRKVESDDELDF